MTTTTQTTTPPMTVTKDNFKDHVQQPGILVLDWWAPWCRPCRAFAPTFEKVAGKHPEVRFGKVNTEEQQELASAMSIRAIPTLMAFRDGVLLFEQAGAVPERVLEELIEKVQALDMDKVQREIAEQERKTEAAA